MKKIFIIIILLFVARAYPQNNIIAGKIAEIKAHISLTNTQSTSLDTIYTSMQTQLTNPSLHKDEYRLIIMNADQAINSILTPTQMAAYQLYRRGQDGIVDSAKSK